MNDEVDTAKEEMNGLLLARSWDRFDAAMQENVLYSGRALISQLLVGNGTGALASGTVLVQTFKRLADPLPLQLALMTFVAGAALAYITQMTELYALGAQRSIGILLSFGDQSASPIVGQPTPALNKIAADKDQRDQLISRLGVSYRRTVIVGSCVLISAFLLFIIGAACIVCAAFVNL